MTEDDAKQKWCPLTHVIIGPDNGSWQNQMFDSRGEHMTTERRANCLGSECAVWHWRTKPGTPDDFNPDDPGDGYCGLTNRA